MSAFKDMVARDIHSVFLDTNFFGEKRTVEYDGERYEDIPVVLMEAEEKDRSKLEDDHVQGLYFVSDTLQCALSDLGGKLPEKGQRLFSFCPFFGKGKYEKGEMKNVPILYGRHPAGKF